MAGAVYLDTSLNYDIPSDNYTASVFFSVKNLLDKDPPPFGQSLPMQPPAPTGGLYDIIGRTFRAGVRFRL